jgi:hypothetical protein
MTRSDESLLRLANLPRRSCPTTNYLYDLMALSACINVFSSPEWMAEREGDGKEVQAKDGFWSQLSFPRTLSGAFECATCMVPYCGSIASVVDQSRGILEMHIGVEDKVNLSSRSFFEGIALSAYP